jgi:hypothetical protein
MVATALCAVAEEELHRGDGQRAVDTIRTIRGVLREINLLLDGDASHIPTGDLRDASGMLAGVENRIAAMEKLVGPQSV